MRRRFNLFCVQYINLNLDKQSGALYSSLATGWDEYELLFLESFLYDDQLPSGTPDDLPNGYWIGLQDHHRNGWDTFSWVDRWPMSFTRWADQEPVTGSCGYVKPGGRWASADCNDQRPFVCKSEFYDVSPDWREIEKKLGPRLPCDDGWVSFGSHCINVNLDKMGWNEAETSCKNRGGHLASIRSENINTYMTNIFNSKWT